MNSDSDTSEKAPSLGKQMKRIGWMLIAAAVVWVVFDQGIPRLLFKTQDGTTQQIEQAAVPQTPAVIAETPPTEFPPAMDAPPLPPEAPPAPPEATLDNAPPPPSSPMETTPFTPAPDALAIQQLRAQLGQANASKQRVIWWQAYDSLKEALLRGHPFRNELLSFQLATGNNARLLDLLSPIMPFADQGIPLSDRLQDNFNTAIPKALAQAAAEEDPDGEWFGSSVNRQLSRWLTVRRVGERVGSDAQSIIARAEAALTNRQLEIALHELESLPPSVQTSFAGFVRDAKAAIAREDVLRKLRETLVMEENAL